MSLDTLSRNLGINRYDISRIFNTVLKTSLPVYINSLRLDKAVHLLRSTSLSITTIALECGYDSLRNFNRQFSKNFQVSPRTYRSQNPGVPHGAVYDASITSLSNTSHIPAKPDTEKDCGN